MAEIPPGLRTVLHFPMTPKVKEVKAEHVVQGTVPPPPRVPPPDPPDPPDPPTARFYTTGYRCVAAYDASAVFALEPNGEAPMGSDGWDPRTEVFHIDPVTSAKTLWSYAPTVYTGHSISPLLQDLIRWEQIGASRNYVYLLGSANGYEVQSIIVVRRPIDGSGDWAIFAKGADFFAPVEGIQLYPGGYSFLPFQNAGVDRETDRVWHTVHAYDAQSNLVPFVVGLRLGHEPLFMQIHDTPTPTLGGPAHWVRTNEGVAILSENPTVLPLLDYTLAGYGLVHPNVLFDLTNGIYRAWASVGPQIHLVNSWTYDTATPGWERDPDHVLSVPPPSTGIAAPEDYIATGPSIQQWTPSNVAPDAAGFLGGVVSHRNGDRTNPFGETSDPIYGVVPTYLDQTLINIDVPEHPQLAGLLPINRSAAPPVAPENRARLALLADGSLLLSGNPQPHPLSPLFVVENADYVAAEHPGRVLTIRVESAWQGTYSIREVNLWTGESEAWSSAPAPEDSNVPKGICITFSHVYVLVRSNNGYAHSIYRKPITATGSDPWELYMTQAEFLALTPGYTDAWGAATFHMLADAANGTLYFQAIWAETASGSVYRRIPGGAWTRVDTCYPTPMHYAGPGNTRVSFLSTDLSVIIIGSDPEERIPAPPIFTGGEIDDYDTARTYQVVYVSPGHYTLFTTPRVDANMGTEPVVLFWTYISGVWSLRDNALHTDVSMKFTHYEGGIAPINTYLVDEFGQVRNVLHPDGFYGFDGMFDERPVIGTLADMHDIVGYTYSLNERLVATCVINV